jgi:hypothetical protein
MRTGNPERATLFAARCRQGLRAGRSRSRPERSRRQVEGATSRLEPRGGANGDEAACIRSVSSPKGTGPAGQNRSAADPLNVTNRIQVLSKGSCPAESNPDGPRSCRPFATPKIRRSRANNRLSSQGAPSPFRPYRAEVDQLCFAVCAWSPMPCHSERSEESSWTAANSLGSGGASSLLKIPSIARRLLASCGFRWPSEN